MRQIVTRLVRKRMLFSRPFAVLWPTHMWKWLHNCLRGKGKRCVCVGDWWLFEGGKKSVCVTVYFRGFVWVNRRKAGPEWVKVRTCGDTVCRHNRCYHTDTKHTQKRSNQTASGMKVINDKWDKLSPLVTHHYTCLPSCAREFFTSPGAKRWHSHGLAPYLSAKISQHQPWLVQLIHKALGGRSTEKNKIHQTWGAFSCLFITIQIFYQRG